MKLLRFALSNIKPNVLQSYQKNKKTVFFMFKLNRFFTCLIEVCCRILVAFFKCAAIKKRLQDTDIKYKKLQT